MDWYYTSCVSVKLCVFGALNTFSADVQQGGTLACCYCRLRNVQCKPLPLLAFCPSTDHCVV